MAPRSARRSMSATQVPRGQAVRQGCDRDGLVSHPLFRGEGVISEILGPRGQPGVDTLGVIRSFNIPDTFDEETLNEARKLGKQFSEAEIGQRLDLRNVLTVTIDPVNARDFDDAITLSRDEQGFWSLGVHIADVSHFVQPGTDLDRTARQRGTSVYLPDRVIPMLPEILSNSLASLQAGKMRYAVSRVYGVQLRRDPHRPEIRPVRDQRRPPVHLRASDHRHEGPRGRP